MMATMAKDIRWATLPRIGTILLLSTLFFVARGETQAARVWPVAHIPIPDANSPLVPIFELRTTTVVLCSRPNQLAEIEHEKSRLLHKLEKPARNADYTKSHIRYRLLSAIDGFQRYGTRAEAGIQRKREFYRELNREQKQLVDNVARYQEKLEHASAAIRHNAKLAEKIATHAMKFYGIEGTELSAFARELDRSGASSDHTSVSQALKHFVRDWSDDGIEERQAVFPQILDALIDLFPERQKGAIKTLVPGSGLGRLAHEIADLGGFQVASNEWSAYMNVAYRFIISLNESKAETFHPYVESWSHQPSTEELLREVRFPDRPASPNDVVHVEGDFTTVFKRKAKFDVIVTLFFIDTARNLLLYFETIRDLLQPGGVWINLGPLLYGSRPFVELSLDEIVNIIESMKFSFMQTDASQGEITVPGTWVRGKEARYGLNPSLLTKNSYMVQFWIARTLK